ncbi:hypothetical protein BWQ96_07880 [Gracilariopsis chorda]|uniref:Uncharacterized protein n=1 Tax=Gracilariopsis chorda TaxID=448386 RepID=A0A2V3IMM0_9FLOR|nr:hypothetical protein BWQ96_07880 [Gracilariopsis chorda]|eukprot:PXF42360.1 hypothetical protein BWQ96_07880 [Gracilariopsis chorda]
MLQGFNVTCGVVALPPRLCSACKLKPILPGGHFEDCTSIFDLESQSCRAELKEYVRLNKHCDPVRAEQVPKMMSSGGARQGLDYFIYSICEQCCDCIPRGTHISQYGFRESIGKLFNAGRGNCPAHAVYDVCKVWPKIRGVVSAGESRKVSAPMVCPHLKTWLRNPDNANWLHRNQVKYHPAVGNFLNSFIDAAGCSARPFWESCVRLETKQKRL